MRRLFTTFSLTLVMAILAGLPAAAKESREQIVIGSKKFTEAVVLGEILTGLVRDTGVDARHKAQMGGTQILWQAVQNGDIDAYVDYSGTLMEQIFSNRNFAGLGDVRAHMKTLGLGVSESIGFVNNYEVAIREDVASRKNIATISDLRNHPGLEFGFAEEFMQRRDGWPGLKNYYNLPHTPRTMDQDLSYRAADKGSIDAVMAYTTDPDIDYYNLRLLKDDKGFFPRYAAVIVYRLDLPAKAKDALLQLEGAIDRQAMAQMNRAVKIDGRSERNVAAQFLKREFDILADVAERPWLADFLRNTHQHLVLVGISLSLAIAVSIPIGIAAFIFSKFGQLILGAVGILQTMPALALFVFMIPPFGIGAPPAIAALFLYSLLPIVRNTHAGLSGIAGDVRESANALGLPRFTRLWRIELPMALPSILAGVKTAAVINVGIATLGALIGAGGYGQPILSGIRLDDMGLIMQGAVPAAILALLVQGLFEVVERFCVSKGLRI